LSSNNYGGYGSKEAQEKALSDAIVQSKKDNPQYFPTLKETIIKNADADKGYLTPSGTYVKIYKNPKNDERVVVTQGDRKYVPPAGTEVSPKSSEGRKIQEIYAQQAETRLANAVQRERFEQITSGNASFRQVLMPNQTAEQQRLTEQFFAERDISLDTPMNQLSLATKYKDAREASQKYGSTNLRDDPVAKEIRKSYEKNKDAFSPEYVKRLQEDRILGAGDLNQYVTSDIFYTVPKDEVTKADPLPNFEQRQQELLTPKESPQPSAGGYYNINVDPESEWNLNRNFKENPLTQSEKADIQQMIETARQEGYDHITIYQERKQPNGDVITSVNTINIEKEGSDEKFSEEYQRILQFGKPDDILTISTHTGDIPPTLPVPEKIDEGLSDPTDSVKIPSTASYSVLGAVFAPEMTKKFVDDIGNVIGNIGSTLGFEQKELEDYRENWTTGVYAPQENLVKSADILAKGGTLEEIQERMENTEMKDTGLDSVVRMYMAGIGARSEGQGYISDDLQKGFFNPDSVLFNPIAGFGIISDRIESQRKIELENWLKYGGYYTATILSDSAQMAVLIPQGRLDAVSGRIGVSVARATLALSPKSVTTASKVASASAKTARVGGKIISNIVVGGTAKNESFQITVKEVMASSEVERKAYPILNDLYNAIKDTPLEQVDTLRKYQTEGMIANKNVPDALNVGAEQFRKLDINTINALEAGRESIGQSTDSQFMKTSVNLGQASPLNRDAVIQVTDYNPNSSIRFTLRKDNNEFIGATNIKKFKQKDKENEYTTKLYSDYLDDTYAGNPVILSNERLTFSNLGLVPSTNYNMYDAFVGDVIAGKSKERMYDSMETRLKVNERIQTLNEYKVIIEKDQLELERLEGKKDTKSIMRWFELKEKIADKQDDVDRITLGNESSLKQIEDYKNNLIEIELLEIEKKKLGKSKKNKEARDAIDEKINELKLKTKNLNEKRKDALLRIYENSLTDSYIKTNFRADGIEDILNDELFRKQIKLTPEQRDEMAQVIAQKRNKPVSAEDYYNVERFVNTKEGRRILASTTLDKIIIARARGEIKKKTNNEFADSVVDYFNIKNELVESEMKRGAVDEDLRGKLDSALMDVYVKDIKSAQERMGVEGNVDGRRLLTPKRAKTELEEIEKRQPEIQKSIVDIDTRIDELIKMQGREGIALKIYSDLDYDTAKIPSKIDTVKLDPQEVEFYARLRDMANATLEKIGTKPVIKNIPSRFDKTLPRGFKGIEKIPDRFEDEGMSFDAQYLDQNVSLKDLADDADLARWEGNEPDYTTISRYLERTGEYDLRASDIKKLRKKFKGDDRFKTSFESEDEVKSAIAEAEINFKATNDIKWFEYKESLDNVLYNPNKGKAGKLGTVEPESSKVSTVDKESSYAKLIQDIEDSILYERAERTKDFAEKWLRENLRDPIDKLERVERDSSLFKGDNIFYQSMGADSKLIPPPDNEYTSLLRKKASLTTSQTLASSNIGALRYAIKTKEQRIKDLELNTKNAIVKSEFKKIFDESIDELKKRYGGQSTREDTPRSKYLIAVENIYTPKNFEDLKTRRIDGEQFYSTEKIEVYRSLEKLIESKNRSRLSELSTSDFTKYKKSIDTVSQNIGKIEKNKKLKSTLEQKLKEEKKDYEIIDNKLTETEKKIIDSPDEDKFSIDLIPDFVSPEKAKKSSAFPALMKIRYELNDLHTRRGSLVAESETLSNRRSDLLERLETVQEQQVSDFGARASLTLKKTTGMSDKEKQAEFLKMENFEQITSGNTGKFDGITIIRLQADRSFTDKFPDASDYSIGTSGRPSASSPDEEIAYSQVENILVPKQEALSDVPIRISSGEDLNTFKVDKIINDLNIEIKNSKGNKYKIKALKESKKEFETIRGNIIKAQSLYDEKSRILRNPVNAKDKKKLNEIENKIQELTVDTGLIRETVLDKVVPKDKIGRIPTPTSSFQQSGTPPPSTPSQSNEPTVSTVLEEMIKPKKDPRAESAWNKIINNYQVSTNAENFAYPLGVPTTIRFPPSTPQEIIEKTNLIEQPQPPEPTTGDTLSIDNVIPERIKALPDNTFSPTNYFQNEMTDAITSTDLSLSPIQDFIKQSPSITDVPAKQIQLPILDTIQDSRIGLSGIYPTPSQITRLNPQYVPTPDPTKPTVPTLPIAPWLDIPYSTRKKKKKERKKKSKKKKIYWEVPSQPFQPFNPKEYYTFRSEPRAIKKKERRKGLD